VVAADDSCQAFYFNIAEGENSVIDSVVVDGSDSQVFLLDPNCLAECRASMGRSVYCSPSTITNSIFRNVANGPILCHGKDIHGNLIENIRLAMNPYMHTNGFEDNGDSINGLLFYNNVIRNLNNGQSGGNLQSVGVDVWIAPLANAAHDSFVFNNVFYNGIQNDCIAVASALSNPGGVARIFNNTASCGPNSANNTGFVNIGADCSAGQRTCYIYNNHIITSASSAIGGTCSAPNCFSDGTNLGQTASTAISKGFNESSLFAFQPTTSSGGTIGTSLNNFTASYCVVISSFNPAAGTACLSDTTYAVGYNTTTHTVSGQARSAALRPPLGNWDIGAYLFGGTARPTPPTGLAAILQ